MAKKITYKSAGVDIDKANGLIEGIKKLINTTKVKGSVDSIGGFSGLFDPAKYRVKNPLLVAGTDGVGTKLKVAQLAGKHDTVGIDLVAMSVNDVICTGARPLFFLDYFAAGKLEGKIWKDVLKGIVEGCVQAECALLGGETAEMPGMYPKGEYDLAGFAVGIVDREKVIDGSKIRPGDVILGIGSSGLHSNGYSLVRKIFTEKELKKYRELLLAPTVIYVKPFLEAVRKTEIKGIAHITGGGFYDNIPRSLTKGVKAVINKGSWDMPPVFDLIKRASRVEEKELYRALNMGIGMVWIMPEKDALKAKGILQKKFRLKSGIIGRIEKGDPDKVEIV